MFALSKTLSVRSRMAALVVGAIIAGMVSCSVAQAETNATIIYWVFDVSTADSQFGYWDGTTSVPVGAIYDGRDFEGMACIGSTIYTTSGGDGANPSQLVRVTYDITADTTIVTNIGTIQTASGTPFYEVSSLAVRPSDNTLWAYAAEAPAGAAGQGIIRIDPATGTAQLMQAATLDVAAVAWLGNTLYLAAGNDMHSWTENGVVGNSLYEVAGFSQIEALDVSPNQNFYIGGDGTTVQEVNPTTGAVINANVFPVTDRQGNSGDPESLTVCQTPTALDDGTEPVQMVRQLYFPAVLRQ